MQDQQQNETDDEGQAIGKISEETPSSSIASDEELFIDYDDDDFDMFNPSPKLKKRKRAVDRFPATVTKASNASKASPRFVMARMMSGTNDAVSPHPVAIKQDKGSTGDVTSSLGWRMLSKLGYDRKSGKGLGVEGSEGAAEAIPLHQKKVERAGLGHQNALARRRAGRVERKSAEQRHEDRIARRAKEGQKKRREALLHKAIYDPRHFDTSGI